MKKKLIRTSSTKLNTLTPKLTGLTRVSPDFIATLNEAKRMKLHEQQGVVDTAAGEQRLGRHRTYRHSSKRQKESVAGVEPPPGMDRGNSSCEHESDSSDLAESPAALSIQSSYKSPVFQHYVDITPCPVDGCPLNPHVRSSKLNTITIVTH